MAGGARHEARGQQVIAVPTCLIFTVQPQKDRPVNVTAIAHEAGGEVARQSKVVVTKSRLVRGALGSV